MRIRRNAVFIFVAVMAVACTGCVGPRSPTGQEAPVAASPPIPMAPADDDVFKQIHLLTQAMVHIRRSYFDEEKTSYRKLMHAALRGMLQGLDPHSHFLDPEAFQELREDTAGEFGGIGITIGMRDQILTVIAPIEDTPAFRAGILAGDKIVEVDGVKTDGLTMADAMHKLRGEVGTQVTLRVLREDSRELQTFALVRAVIRVPSVRGARLLNDVIGYVRITQFSETTAEQLQLALEKLLADGMQALVLDLRNNAGGLLESAIQVSQKFLAAGTPIVTTRGRGGQIIGAPVRAGGPDHYPDFPMAILVNGGTASAAEIVAASLQDNHRAILVGERTFGKGSVQSVLPLAEDAAIRLTTARYFTPSERVIHEKGIDPDIVAPMPPEVWRRVQLKRAGEETPEIIRDLGIAEDDVRDATDNQLDRAMDLLKALLIFQAVR